MRKHIILLGGITAAAAICVSTIGVTLYAGSSRTDIRQYDLYGDSAAADGITYTAQITDDENTFYAEITNSIGGDTQANTHFSSPDVEGEYDDWPITFSIRYGITAGCYDYADSDLETFITDQPDCIKKMVKDCLTKTDSDHSETSEEFRINLQDYAEEMPYTIEVDTVIESFSVSYPQDANDRTWSELFDLLTMPLADPYYVDILLEKDENGDLQMVDIEPENNWCAFNVDGVPIGDTNSYLFYYAPNDLSQWTEIAWPDTETAVLEKDVCGLYRADFLFEDFEKTTDGYYAGDFMGIQITRMDHYSDYLYKIGEASLNETTTDSTTTTDSATTTDSTTTSDSETGKSIWLFRSEKGVVLEMADRDGIRSTLDITLPQEDTSDSLSLDGTNQTNDGIYSCILSDGTAIIFREEADGSLTELFTTKLMTEKEETEMITTAIPGYSDYVDYSDNGQYVGDSEDDSEDTASRPVKTWYNNCIMLYKDNKIAFITLADRYNTTMSNPGTVYVTVYNADGLQYAGFFRNMYTSYIYRGFYNINWFISDHHVSRNSSALSAAWN